MLLLSHNFSVHSIGDSVGGKPLWTIQLGLRSQVHSAKSVKVKYIAGIHGNDRVNTELLLQFIGTLCENYKQDFMITQVSIYLYKKERTNNLCNDNVFIILNFWANQTVLPYDNMVI